MQPLGPEAIHQRMAEIRRRMNECFPAKQEPKFSALLSNISADVPPMPVIAPENLTGIADQIAEENGIDSGLFRALVNAESSWNPNAQSPAGAMGLTQLMPATAKSLGVANPYDPIQNLQGGAKYLKGLLNRFGTPELALAAYNAGPGAVARYNGIPPFRETQNYVRKIMGSIR